jgi:hypothetical protein
VRIKDGCEVAGLVTTLARDRVTGARVVAQGGDAEEMLTGNLRARRAPAAEAVIPVPSPITEATR